MPLVVMHRSATRRVGSPIPVLSLIVANHWIASEGVTVGTGGVASWLDRITAANLQQTTEARRPQLIASSLNDLPAIRFDAVDDVLAGVSVPGDAPHTVFTVVTNYTPQAGSTYVHRDPNQTALGLDLLNTGLLRMEAGGFPVSGISASSPASYIAIYDGADSTLYKDGVQGNDPVNVGGNLHVSSFIVGAGTAAGVSASDAEVLEIAILTGKATAQDVVLLTNYVLDRYNF